MAVISYRIHPFMGLLIKWFAVSLRRGLSDGRCGGRRIPAFEFGKHFRMTGWDLASASMAFYVVALVCEQAAT